MALVQLADAIIPEVYSDYQVENGPEKTRMLSSGILVSSDLLNQKANSGGYNVDVPFWKDLDATAEPNYSDDSENSATPQKATAGKQIARVSYLNQGWKDADLVTELSGSDPMRHIASRTSTYWDRQLQRRLIAISEGVKADNIANDSSDMVHDIAIEAGNSATASNLYSKEAFVEAVFTMGDSWDNISAIAVHSVIMKRMILNDDIDFEKDSTGALTIPTFMGKPVFVDDGLDVTAGTTNGFKYTSVLYGAGAFGLGTGSPSVPVAVERKESEGQGGGTETLWERKTWLIHPFGFQWIEGSIAGESPTLAEIDDAAHWDRVVDRKNVPLSFLITNG